MSENIVAEAKYVSEENMPRCSQCGNFIDDCNCVCPYCGETSNCTCCVGIDKGTGGG